MPFHIVLSRNIDFDSIEADAARRLRPRHAMKQLADRLGATVHSPSNEKGGFLDAVRSKLIGSPLLWAYARSLSDRVSAEDVVYCPDEEVGLALSSICRATRNRVKIAVMVHNVDRPRARLALKMIPGCRSADLYMAVSKRQIGFLQRGIGINEERTAFVDDQTDASFFKPGSSPEHKHRPLLVSAGLEKRDYRVLADAVGDLDLDVCATGFSADAKPSGSSLPDVWPPNFTRRRYEWTELADLYRSADAVVVTLVPNIYAAGITTMVEGMASGCPIIVTRTEGLDGYLDDTDAITVVSPGNVEELRNAVVSLINSPERRATMGRRAHEIAEQRYSSEVHVEVLAGMLQRLKENCA